MSHNQMGVLSIIVIAIGVVGATAIATGAYWGWFLLGITAIYALIYAASLFSTPRQNSRRIRRVLVQAEEESEQEPEPEECEEEYE